MTKDELVRLDNYGHRELGTLEEEQLRDYVVLLMMKKQEASLALWKARMQVVGRYAKI